MAIQVVDFGQVGRHVCRPVEGAVARHRLPGAVDITVWITVKESRRTSCTVAVAVNWGAAGTTRDGTTATIDRSPTSIEDCIDSAVDSLLP